MKWYKIFEENWFLILTIIILIIYFILAKHFLPPATFDITGDVPWNASYNISASNVSSNLVQIVFSVRDFDNRTYFSVGSFIVFSLNITNGDNVTISMIENTTADYPVDAFNEVQNFTLMPNESKYLEQYVPILRAGPNRVDFKLQIKNGDSLSMEYYANPVDYDEKQSLLFNKYSLWFSFIGGTASIVIIMSNIKGMLNSKKYNFQEKKNRCKKMKIYIDGSGKGKYGFFIEETNEAKVFNKSNITSNQAEYLAVLEALKFTKGDIEIYSDSKLVVNQLNHKWNIKNDNLRVIAVKIWKHIGNREVNFVWISREQNKAGKLLG